MPLSLIIVNKCNCQNRQHIHEVHELYLTLLVILPQFGGDFFYYLTYESAKINRF